MALDRMPRPTPQPKPQVRGTQTATVTTAGDDHFVDAHGRVKVQFHWDREGQRNAESSCWIRVAQAWAGDGWGSQFLPRQGQEVVVSFHNGDPDQPLITGAAYNGHHAMPYAPDEQPHVSGIKSRSIQGGAEHYNELRFDDRQGQELLLLHAERDHELTVEQDQRDAIGRDRQTQVTRDDITTVGKDQRITIEGHQQVKATRTIIVQADERLIMQAASGNARITLDDAGVKIDGQQVVINGYTLVGVQSPTIKLN